jgi:hypothetical protein
MRRTRKGSPTYAATNSDRKVVVRELCTRHRGGSSQQRCPRVGHVDHPPTHHVESAPAFDPRGYGSESRARLSLASTHAFSKFFFFFRPNLAGVWQASPRTAAIDHRLELLLRANPTAGVDVKRTR